VLVPLYYGLARIAGIFRPKRRAPVASGSEPADPPPPQAAADGVSVVIPSRNGRELLDAQLPEVIRQLDEFQHEIVVVDNGSEDHTAEWLSRTWPQVRVVVSAEPLSFSRAVNRGIALARYSHICLLNNDMLLAPGFFAPLGSAFERIPGLFCATAQIHFPPGVRREETGKAVLTLQDSDAFPVRCDTPLPGEDQTWVLYGSGGCSVYDTAKLRELGALDEAYDPAYVEDLDLGYRAWQRGWPSVYVAGSAVEHRHRATTSRYYTSEELDRILEINYLKFLARAVASRKVFRRLWAHAVRRLRMRAPHDPAARHALSWAASIALRGGPAQPSPGPEDLFLALTGGAVAVFPGRGHNPSNRTTLLVARPSVSLAARAGDAGQVLVTFTKDLDAPPPEILSVYAEVVLVRRRRGERQHPDPAFRAALGQTMRKWRIQKVRLETREMEAYVPDCAPTHFILT
jgi:GT2 family glycosyltransferase